MTSPSDPDPNTPVPDPKDLAASDVTKAHRVLDSTINGSGIVEQALGRSRDVKAQVEAGAVDLGVANATVKKEIVDGAISAATYDALASSDVVEKNLQASADELHQVNESLAEGIVELKQTHDALDLYKRALADSDAALADSRASELRAQHRAFTDPATGLPNRALFDDRLSQAIAMAERNQWMLAVLFFDLDRFKTINDLHGHAAGDQVLRQVAKRLESHCRDTDTLCRHGGDEFLYLLMNPQGRDNISNIAATLITDIAEPIEFGSITLKVNASIGISLYPEHAVDAALLIDQADTAMYRAKREASGFSFF